MSLKMSCLRSRTALLFGLLDMGQGHDFFSSSRRMAETSRYIYEDLFFCFFVENVAIVDPWLEYNL